LRGAPQGGPRGRGAGAGRGGGGKKGGGVEPWSGGGWGAWGGIFQKKGWTYAGLGGTDWGPPGGQAGPFFFFGGTKGIGVFSFGGGAPRFPTEGPAGGWPAPFRVFSGFFTAFFRAHRGEGGEKNPGPVCALLLGWFFFLPPGGLWGGGGLLQTARAGAGPPFVPQPATGVDFQPEFVLGSFFFFFRGGQPSRLKGQRGRVRDNPGGWGGASVWGLTPEKMQRGPPSSGATFSSAFPAWDPKKLGFFPGLGGARRGGTRPKAEGFFPRGFLVGPGKTTNRGGPTCFHAPGFWRSGGGPETGRAGRTTGGILGGGGNPVGAQGGPGAGCLPGPPQGGNHPTFYAPRGPPRGAPARWKAPAQRHREQLGFRLSSFPCFPPRFLFGFGLKGRGRILDHDVRVGGWGPRGRLPKRGGGGGRGGNPPGRVYRKKGGARGPWGGGVSLFFGAWGERSPPWGLWGGGQRVPGGQGFSFPGGDKGVGPRRSGREAGAPCDGKKTGASFLFATKGGGGPKGILSKAGGGHTGEIRVTQLASPPTKAPTPRKGRRGGGKVGFLAGGNFRLNKGGGAFAPKHPWGGAPDTVGGGTGGNRAGPGED